MQKQFIPYEQALELKQLGFEEECFSFYDTQGELYESEGGYKQGRNVLGQEVAAPLYQQAFAFFRNQYGYSFSIGRTNICVYHLMVQGTLLTNMIQDCKSYEEAELKCIQAFIDAAKQINR